MDVNKEEIVKEQDTKIPKDLDKQTINEDRRVKWEAAAKGSVRVVELKRTCEEYMALPASQYSVLSANQVTRLSDTEFKYNFGSLNFFGTKINPILYVTVNVFPDQAKSEIIVSRAETIGSDIAQMVNGTFNISAINIVSAGRDNKGRKTLNSETTLIIEAIVPNTRLSVPNRIVKTGGNFIIQSALSLIVPTFVRILAADFKKWSAGDNSRAAVDGASLNI